MPPVTSILKMEGDTLVDNKLYKKIYSTRDTVNQVWSLDSRLLIREDSSKKVWLRKVTFDGSEEMLLYDFDLMVGDSFAVNLAVDQMCKIPVTSVDSITLSSGEKRKRINFSYFLFGDIVTETSWIEGIGGLTGLIYHQDHYCGNPDASTWLRCYFEDGERLFGQVPDGECFSLITSTDELDTQTRFSIYPNPVREQITLILPDDKSRSWELFNYQGQLIRNGEVNNDDDQISVENLPAGIYFLKIKNLGIEKVVVQ